jgi:hypothetical protein
LRYDRFKTAWEDWLAANAGFDWCNERVVEKIELVLARLQLSFKRSLTGKSLACKLAERFGTVFSQEMKKHALSEKNTDDWKEGGRGIEEARRIFDLAFPKNVIADIVFTAKQKDSLRKVFADIYPRYFEVTLKLWKVVLQLAKLQSIYPPATLHDCDEGSDENPVRLGNTMLGG